MPSTPSAPSQDPALRLAPLDRAPSLLVRLFDAFVRARFGKAMMPSRVIYARLPGLLWRQLGLVHLAQRGLSIEVALRDLIEVQVSRLNGCAFCSDLHQATARMHDARAHRFAALPDFERDPAFSARERAALRYVGEVCAQGSASDATFEGLRAHFGEREIVEITWLQAFTTYLNRLAVPLGIGSDGFCELLALRARRGEGPVLRS